jgi:hypothetical protein
MEEKCSSETSVGFQTDYTVLCPQKIELFISSAVSTSNLAAFLFVMVIPKYSKPSL